MKNFYTYIFSYFLIFTISFSYGQKRGCTAPPAPQIENDQIVLCESEKLKLSDIDIIGENIKWYSTETSTIPLDPSDLVKPGKFYVSQSVIIDATYFCESEQRLEVKIVASSIKTPDIKLEENVFCAVNKKELKDSLQDIWASKFDFLSWN